MWTLDDAQNLVTECLGNLPRRLAHLRAAGRTAECLANSASLSENVVLAVTVHDIGYGDAVRALGFHPVDGAKYLEELGAPAEVVALVAHHTGASFEARERGLSYELGLFPEPDARELDVVTMIDLATGPNGEAVLDIRRIEEILERYNAGDPVFEAVTRSREYLLACSTRGKRALGLPDKWPLVGEGMLDS